MTRARRDDELLLVESLRGEARRDSSIGTIAMSMARASRSSRAGCQARSNGRPPCGGRSCRTPMSMPGARAPQRREQRRKQHGRDAVGRADREAARGRGRIERLGLATTLLTRARISAIGSASSVARAVGHHALRRPQKQRIVEKPAQPAEAVTDRRRRQVQPLGRAADMPLVQHGLEQHQQVEVGAR